MYKQFKGYLNSSIIISALGIIFGTILIIFPSTSLDLISNTISLILVIFGIVGIINDQKNKVVINQVNITSNIILLVVGIVLLFNEAILESIIPIILGIIFTISGLNKMKYSIMLKNMNEEWIVTFIPSLIATICGIIMIIRPVSTSVLITTFMGILIVLFSVSSMIDVVILKRKAKNFNDYFSKKLK